MAIVIPYTGLVRSNDSLEDKLVMTSDPIRAGTAPFVTELAPGEYWWCACGRSSNQPWCDGSHKACDIVPVKVVITEEKRYALCVCKQSKKGWQCDGTHKQCPPQA